MNKFIGVLCIAFVVSCNNSAIDRKIAAETALDDVLNIEKQEGELSRYHQKFLNSIAFIADDKGIDQTKIKELFKLFTDSGITYRMVFEELARKNKFEQEFTQQYLLPLYNQIDSLCLYRQDAINIILDGTSEQIDSLVKSGGDTGFISYINPHLRNHYQYITPDVLDGQCAYLRKQDSLHKQHDSLYDIMQEQLVSKFKVTTTYYYKLNAMFDVHQ